MLREAGATSISSAAIAHQFSPSFFVFIFTVDVVSYYSLPHSYTIGVLALLSSAILAKFSVFDGR